MKDEEMAKEYAKLNARQYKHNDGIGFCTSAEEVKQAFLDGFKDGYNKLSKPFLTDSKTAITRQRKKYEKNCLN